MDHGTMLHLVKFIHVSTVILSYLLFWTRGLWMIRDPARLQRRWVRIVPHVIDTLLLASGITLAVLIHQYPLVDGWLTAKLTGLIAYIGLGLVALRLGRRRGTRVVAWISAQGVFFYIVAVAVTRNPLPFSALL